MGEHPEARVWRERAELTTTRSHPNTVPGTRVIFRKQRRKLLGQKHTHQVSDTP